MKSTLFYTQELHKKLGGEILSIYPGPTAQHTLIND